MLGRLDVILGADVRGLISAEGAVNTITRRIEQRFQNAADKSAVLARSMNSIDNVLGGVLNSAQNVLRGIDLSALPPQQQTIARGFEDIVQKADIFSQSATIVANVWAVAIPTITSGLTGLAARFPAIGRALIALTGPIGLVVAAGVAAAGLLIANWDKFNESVSTTEQVMRDSSAEINENAARVTTLVNVVNDQTESYDRRNSALRELKAISPGYFSDLSLEKAAIDSNNESLKNYIGNMAKKIQVKNLEQKAVENFTRVLEIETTLKERAANPTAGQNILKSLPGPVRGVVEFAVGFDNNISLDNERTALNKEIDELTKEIQSKSATIVNDGPIEKEDKARKTKISTLKEERNTIEALRKTTQDKIDIEVALRDANETTTEEFVKNVERIRSAAIGDAVTLGVKFNVNQGDIQEFIDDINATRQPVVIPIEPINLAPSVVFNETQIKEKGKEVTRLIGKEIQSLNVAAIQIPDINIKPKVTPEIDPTKLISQLQAAMDLAVPIINGVSDVINQFQSSATQKRTEEMESYYEKEKTRIENSYLPQAKKTEQLRKLDEKADKDRKKIQLEEAKGAKSSAIFSAIVRTAEATVSGLAKGGPVLAGIYAALGAAQIAAISSAPLPKLAKGGIVYGDSIVNVGEYAGASTNPEVIAPLDRLTSIITDSLGDVNISGRSDAVMLHSVIRGDDIHQLGVLQEYKSKRIR